MGCDCSGHIQNSRRTIGMGIYGLQVTMSELLVKCPQRLFRITLIGLNMMTEEANAEIHPPNKLSGLLSARLTIKSRNCFMGVK